MKKGVTILIFILLLSTASAKGQVDYLEQRKTMVRLQIQARGVNQPATLSAMLNVPRHEFVPEDKKVFAYSDSPLSIGQGQTISQPYIVAYMTQALRLRRSHKVLEIGTGSGYQAAVLSKIVDSIFTIEIVKELASSSKSRLQRLGYENVLVRWGDGYDGWPEKAPFDAIMVTAGAEEIPQPLLDQLKVGGRMIIPVGPHNQVRQLVLVIKKKDKIVKKNVMPVRFVPFTRAKNED